MIADYIMATLVLLAGCLALLVAASALGNDPGGRSPLEPVLVWGLGGVTLIICGVAYWAALL